MLGAGRHSPGKNRLGHGWTQIHMDKKSSKAQNLSQARVAGSIYLSGRTRARGRSDQSKVTIAPPTDLLLKNAHRAQECGATTLLNEWFTPEENHAWPRFPRVRENLWKIQIIRHQYVATTASIIGDIAVLGPYGINRGPMDCLVARLD